MVCCWWFGGGGGVHFIATSLVCSCNTGAQVLSCNDSFRQSTPTKINPGYLQKKIMGFRAFGCNLTSNCDCKKYIDITGS